MAPYKIIDEGLIWQGGQKLYELSSGIEQIELYHGTSTVFLDDILSEGLKPRGLTGKSNYDGSLLSNPKYVYLAAMGQARGSSGNALSRWGGSTVLIRLIMDTSTLLPDEDGSVLEKGAERFRAATDWIESIEHSGTCAYEGIIAPEKFLEAIIYKRCRWDGVLKRIDLRR